MSGQRVEFVAKAAFVVALGSLGVFVAVRAAVARDGVVGSARTFVTVAGTLTGPGLTPGARPVVNFEFQRAATMGAPAVECQSSVTVAVGEQGAFSAAVPILAPGSTCPDGFFDGRDVQVRAVLGGAVVADWAPISPVPYAHFATSAGTATRALQGPEVIQDTLDRSFATTTGGVIPGLRISLPRAGTYLLFLNASAFGYGDGNRGELNYVELVAGTQRIARRVIPGRGAEPSTTQRSSNLTLIAPFVARGPVDVTAEISFPFPSGTVELGGDDSSTGTTALIAIPVREGL